MMPGLGGQGRPLLLLLVVMALCCGLGYAQCPLNLNYVNPDCIVGGVSPDPSTCNFQMKIYEDCPVDSVLLTFDETGFAVECSLFKLVGGSSVGLNTGLDTESTPSIDCASFITQDDFTDVYVLVSVEDVDEFSPYIYPGTTLTEYIPENNEPNIDVLTFSVSDPDSGELQSLVYTFEADSAAGKFELTPGECTSSACPFTLTVLEALDYETGMFYELGATFTTGDTKDNTDSVTLQMLVFVEDEADSPPFWSKMVPSASVYESDEVQPVFNVQAQDWDTSIDNAVKYEIVAGNDLRLFEIDPVTGYVDTTKAIDREALESTFFSLDIQATEVLEDGSIAPPPNSITQVTIVQILDVNDNSPTFEENEITLDIEEMTDTNSPGGSTTITLQDMDQGEASEYTIVSDDPAHLEVSPTSGSGSVVLTLKTIYVDGNNLFDSEGPDGLAPISFTVTATEVADPTHTNDLTVTVTFTDVNDNDPVFSESEQYATSVSESTASGTTVITVAATDNDVSDEFGTKSIRYSLENCLEDLAIDEVTGVVTLARQPDYETTPSLDCSVQARDEQGAGHSTSIPLNITIEDVNDTPPSLTAQATAEVLEDAATGFVVLSVTAADPDTTADVAFDVTYADGTDPTVKGWFTIVEVACADGVVGFCGDVTVDSELDREQLSDPYQVVITVLATDEAADTGTQAVTKDVIITLLDVNDVVPEFCFNCTVGLSVLEDAQDGTAIAAITASDPDQDDQGTLVFTCSDNEKVDIDPSTGSLFVVDGSAIDREQEEEFTVTLTVTDTANHFSDVEVTVTVLDINDNPPVLNDALCTAEYTVLESETTGYVVVQLTATDADEGVHGEQTYVLQNDILTSGTNPYTPFAVSDSGLVTVYEDADLEKELDRESFDVWQLNIRVYDGCENEEFTCRSLMGECEMTITVGDVNDQVPVLLQPLTLYAGEELMMGDVVPASEITAFDEDLINSTNTEIHYTVIGFRDKDTGEDLDLAFQADDYNELNSQLVMEWSCRLSTTQDLANMTATYTLLINATSGPLEDPVNFNVLEVTVEITDANDNRPVIVFDGCLAQNGPIIQIYEDKYKAGDAIPCIESAIRANGRVQLSYTDGDTDSPNNEATIEIDYDNSVVDPTDFYPGQLHAFVLVPNGDLFDLVLDENMIGNLSLEQGKSYNLTLIATDHGDPPLTSTGLDWIFVNLTEISEFPPQFCEDLEDCVATTYITENTQEIGVFPEAYDLDNVGNYTFDTIYYYVISLDSCFDIPPGSTELHQLTPVCDLDREAQASYTVLVQATNINNNHPPLVASNEPVSTDMLQVTVIIMDVNDNAPSFDTSVVFGSVLQSGSVGQQAAILQANDLDLNWTLSYEFAGDFVWDPPATYGVNVFEIDNNGTIGTVVLSMTPSALNGYCIVPVIVFDELDTGENNDTSVMQIFIVESSHQVPFYFENDIETLQNDEESIVFILSSVFRYEAFIDSMTPTSGTDNRTMDSVLDVHFINTTAAMRNTDAPGNIVAKSVITSMASSGRLSTELQEQLQQIGLRLYRVGDYVVEDKVGLEQQLLTYQIVLGVVAMLLGSLVFLLLAAYIVRTRKLERRVKVLSTNTFGSKASDLDKAGMGVAMDVIPNSNMFKGEGANPMFNTSFKEFDRQETGSLSSGDSVLVGVEDNPEFRDYTGGIRPSLSPRDSKGVVGAGGMTSSNPLFANMDKKSEGGDSVSRVSSNDDGQSQESGDLGVINSTFSFL